MAGEQKLFLKTIASVWRTEFPLFRPLNLREVPQVPKGCNYLCDAYGDTRSRYYFIRLNFSSKCRGQFSIGVTISPSPERSTLDPAMASQPTSTSIGSFGIWQFMHRPRFDWSLVDLEAESMALLGISSGSPKSPNEWRPSTYTQPVEKIVEEAIAHVNQTLRTHVFPVLQIEA